MRDVSLVNVYHEIEARYQLVKDGLVEKGGWVVEA